MADDEDLNYFEAISLLKEMNLPLPDGVENVGDPAIFSGMQWPPFEYDTHACGEDAGQVPRNQHGSDNAAVLTRLIMQSSLPQQTLVLISNLILKLYLPKYHREPNTYGHRNREDRILLHRR